MYSCEMDERADVGLVRDDESQGLGFSVEDADNDGKWQSRYGVF